MKVMEANGVALHYADVGPVDGPAIVFANSLGTDFRLWDDVVRRLAGDFRIVRYDKRGHGLSGCPRGPCSAADLAADAASLMDGLGIMDSLFVGISIGGMIGQQLALARPDLVAAAVLSNTGAKIGSAEMWDQRIAAVRDGGVDAIGDAVIERWFSRDYRSRNALHVRAWREMLGRTPAEGYAACCEALKHADLTREVAGLKQPVLFIAGSEDGSTPPALVKGTADRIHGSRFRLFEGAGHLPCVEQPERYAETIFNFGREVGVL